MAKPRREAGLLYLKNRPEMELELEAQAELHDARVVGLVENKGGADATVATEFGDGAGA